MTSWRDAPLHLDWCSHEAAKAAVRRWYYRPDMPVSKLVRIGVWERGEFVGVVIFGAGASNALGKRFGLTPLETCELVRIALASTHKTPISRILRVALLLLRRRCPDTRLVITFADPTAGHHGGVYQANGWTYLGKTVSDKRYLYRGQWYHSRGVDETGFRARPNGKRTPCPKPSECEKVERTEPKHRYGYALDPSLASALKAAAKPYPKRSDSDISTSYKPSRPSIGTCSVGRGDDSRQANSPGDTSQQARLASAAVAGDTSTRSTTQSATALG